MTIERAQIPKTGIDIPPNGMLPDPPRSYDMRQRQQFYRIDSALKGYFSDRDDVLISGEGYLRHDPDNEDETFAPDLIVTFGVEDPDRIIARNGYVVSEVGKPPDFILEVASPSTGARDYTVKRDGYARYKGGEYWRFDESGGLWHDAPLAGDKLVNGLYVPFPIRSEPDGLVWGNSEVLGLDLCWDRKILRFRDPKTGLYLPDAEDMKRERDAAEARVVSTEVRAEVAENMLESAQARAESKRERLAAERARADAERARAESERSRAESERARAATAENAAASERARAQAAEAEIERLKEMLRRRNQ